MFVKVLRTMSQYFIVIYVCCAISCHPFLINVIVRKTNVAMKECKNLNEFICISFNFLKKKSAKTNAAKKVGFFLVVSVKVRPFEGAAHTHFYAI